MVFFKNVILVAALSGAASVSAMEMTYEPAGTGAGRMEQWPATITLEGPVEWGDQDKLRAILERHPDVEQVIIGQSPGGSLYAGIYMAEVLYDSGLPLKLIGPAASAATVISLGARTEVNFGEENDTYRGTKLLFHCAYIRGESVCDGRATEALSEALAKFTRRSADDWYDFLMEETTPDTVEPVRMFSILNREWQCAPEDFRGTTCFRIPSEDDLIGPMVASGTFEVIEASRPSLQEALQYVEELRVRDKRYIRIFESNNGWFAVSRYAVNRHICTDMLKDPHNPNFGGFMPDDAFCSPGDNFVAKFDGLTGEEIPTTSEWVPAVFEVRRGALQGGAIPIQTMNVYPSETIGKISEGGQFFVEQIGREYWLIRDRTTRISGFIYANHEIVSIYR